MSLLRYVLLVLLIACSALPCLANTRTLTPKVWRGELMEADEGAFYLQSILLDPSAQKQRGNFLFTLKGRKRQLSYVFQTDTVGLSELPDLVWKLKDDDYDLLSLVLVDDKGRKWDWKGPYRHSFKIQSKSLSYFGVWYLVQIKDSQQLKLLAKPGKNVFGRDKSQGAFQAIIEGGSGRELQSLKEKKAKEKNEIRHVMRSSRTIGMFYQLNLFRQNTHAASMVQVLEANDPDLRSCYTDLIERTPDLQGKLTYTFVYSSQTRSIKSLKIKQSDLREAKFLECMNLKIMGLGFAINTSLIGELSFNFQLGSG